MVDVNDMIIERLLAGDCTAYQDIIEENSGLAVYIARRYTEQMQQRNDIDLDDLIQAGYIGIISAAGKYDPERGMKFSSFAVFFIRREIRRTLGILYSKNKRDPLMGAISINTPINENEPDGATLGDLIAAEEEPSQMENEDLRRAVRAAVGRIENDISRKAIEEYYWNGKTMGQIANDDGVSHEAVSQRMFRGYDALKRDYDLQKWAVDYDYVNVYRHKGVRAFNASFSSVVEDIVIQAEARKEKRENKRAALADVLGSLL